MIESYKMNLKYDSKMVFFIYPKWMFTNSLDYSSKTSFPGSITISPKSDFNTMYGVTQVFSGRLVKQKGLLLS